MIKKFQTFIESIISTKAPSEIHQHVRLTNKIALIVSCVAFPYIFLFRPYSIILADVVILIIGSFLLVIVLNKFYLYNISRFLLILSTNITAMYYAGSFGVSSGIQNLFFAYLVLPMVIFEFREIKKIAIGCSISMAGVLYLELTKYYSPTKVLTSGEFQNLIRLSSIFFVSIIIFLSIKSLIFALQNMYQQLLETHKNLEASTQDLIISNNKLSVSLSIQQKLFTDLQTESSEKTLALEKAKTEQLAKEEALLREQEKIALIYEQQQTIDNNQVELAEKANMDKMLKISEAIQKKMLQSEFPLHDDYAFSVFFKPSHMISGDYFSVKELENGMIGFFVIDVTGHGTPAAILMTGVAIHLESLLSPLDPVLHTPSDVLSCLDNRLSKSLYVSKAVACSYSLYNPKTHELRSALGGAEPLRIWRHGKISTVCGGDGPVLNMFPDNAFPESRIVLEHDDVVLNFTDGLIELVLLNGEPLIPLTTLANGALSYDYHNLETILAGIPVSFLDAAHIGNSLLAACQKPKDDITLLVLQNKSSAT